MINSQEHDFIPNNSMLRVTSFEREALQPYIVMPTYPTYGEARCVRDGSDQSYFEHDF